MAEAGVNLVSVGIFCWSQLEPSPGRRNHPRVPAGIARRSARAWVTIIGRDGRCAVPLPWVTRAGLG